MNRLNRLARRLWLAPSLWVASCLWVAGVQADTPCEPDCVAVSSWQFNLGVGLGLRSNPLHQGEDTPLLLIPEVSYYGERFFLKNFEAGWTLFENPRHQLNLLITPSYDQMHFNRWDPFNLTGSTGIGGSIAAPTPAPLYEVRLSSLPQIGGGSPSVPMPSVPGEGGVGLNAAEAIYINGQAVLLEEGRQTFTSRGGNPITVYVANRLVIIDGLVPGDAVSVQAPGPVRVTSRGGAYIEQSPEQNSGQDGSDGTNLATLTLDNNLVYNLQSQPFARPSDTQALRLSARDLRKRRMAALAGLEYSYSLPWLQLQTQILSDISGVHQGQELRLAAMVPWQTGSHKWALTLGANYKNHRVLDYYYGISDRDTASVAYWFDPGKGGVETRVRLDWQKPLSEHWSLRALLQYTRLPSAIHSSPLVSESHQSALFFGGVYHF